MLNSGFPLGPASFILLPMRIPLTLVFIFSSAISIAPRAAALVPSVDGPIWTDPAAAAAEDPDFLLQGEYLGKAVNGQKWGLQVVAQGNGRFEAFLIRNGLPGENADAAQPRFVLFGERYAPGVVALKSADDQIHGVIREASALITHCGEPFATLARIERRSPTLGASPPAGAIVLFDGSSASSWTNAEVLDGHLSATNALSQQGFRDYTLHLEFRTPYKPLARFQKRGNSGVYFGGRWETQILDSFGLTGEMNECGGLYSIAPPLLNACLPPLTWQTYDVDFTAPRFDAKGKVTAWPRITVRLNGILIHED